MTKERSFDEQGRAVALPIFDHQTGSKLEVFRLPGKFRKISDVIDVYTSTLIPPMNGVGIRLKDPDAPECLPVCLAEYRDYRVFVKELGQVLGIVVRFRDFVLLEEARLRCQVWTEALSLIDLIQAEITKEAERRGKGRS